MSFDSSILYSNVSDPHEGNEVSDLSQALSEVEFPIPMRGNETRNEAAWLARSKVSDPHEG